VTVRERILTFGEDGERFGLASLPPGGVDPKRPALLLLNAGVMPRVGPFRWYVELARRAAAQGTLTLRFDHVGVGDAPPMMKGPLATEIAAAASAAMDALTRAYGVERFVVGGLCTGALESHNVALVEPRVKAMVLLDGYAFKTPTFYRELLRGKLARPASWPGTLRRAAESGLQRLVGRAATSAPSDVHTTEAQSEEAQFFDGWPTLEQARAELSTIVERGVRGLFVYTGGWSDFVHPKQFDEMFPGVAGRGVRVHFIPQADHSYLIVQHREAMLRAVVDFLAEL
jgi:pimeloyl-ACP methyl ester carboxylesterase